MLKIILIDKVIILFDKIREVEEQIDSLETIGSQCETDK